MANLDVSVGLIDVQGGKRDVVMVIGLGDGASCISWQLDANSARRLAAMLIAKASEAASPIVAPGFDSTRIPRA